MTVQTIPIRRKSAANDVLAGLDRSQQAELVRSLNMRAPRYTSYPTADRFVEAIGSEAYARALGAQALTQQGPLSLYLHIPFCKSLCYYCACNKIVTNNRDRIHRYVDLLVREIDLVLAELSGTRDVASMHWGGGTPTILPTDDLGRLLSSLRERFEFTEGGEYSIEVDPRATDEAQIRTLGEFGFNRISIGVQDLDPRVQSAINRVQPIELTRAALEAARSAGYRSVNFDLIYGLPYQTEASFADTVRQVLDLRPDRLALYHYAHLPARFKAQRLLPSDGLPEAEVKTRLFHEAVAAFQDAGYIYIGMDHFALPDDDLAQAFAAGRLHRGFQGYSTHPDNDLLSFGTSAISRVGPAYFQNYRKIGSYENAVEAGELPIARGIQLSRDDTLRRAVIMAIMCQGKVFFDSISDAYLIDFASYFRAELETLADFEAKGLVTVNDTSIIVTDLGMSVGLRIVASVFDKYQQGASQRQAFSQVL